MDRAKRHVQELATLIWEYIDQLERDGQGVFAFEQEYRPRSRCIVVYIADVQPTDPSWGIIVGDVLHNFRSALDHIAWRLVEEGSRPPHTLTKIQQRHVQFPIFTKREDFNDWLPRRLPGVDRRKLAVVRRYQPYRWGQRRAHRDALAVLERLSNLDKHRALQLALFRPYGAVFAGGKNGVGFEPLRVVWPKPLSWQPGTEILRVYGRRTGPNPYLDVQVRSSADVTLEGGFWIGDFVQRVRMAIGQIMSYLRPLMH